MTALQKLLYIGSPEWQAQQKVEFDEVMRLHLKQIKQRRFMADCMAMGIIPIQKEYLPEPIHITTITPDELAALMPHHWWMII